MTQSNDSACWTLQAHNATFDSPEFSACVDLLDPGQGLSKLGYNGSSIQGSVLGVAPNKHAIGSLDEIADAYVRSADLVVCYAQTESRPYALQVYWRVNIEKQRTAQVDVIISVQTRLLESFPNIVASTSLPAAVHQNFSEANLLRNGESDWSYAESVHPEDTGEQKIESHRPGQTTLINQLGGQFLEKGVIRRLRIRGLFLPSENDAQLARKLLATHATEEPPLTV